MRAWILPFFAVACLALSCRSRTADGDRPKSPDGPKKLVLQVEGMTKVEGLT